MCPPPPPQTIRKKTNVTWYDSMVRNRHFFFTLFVVCLQTIGASPYCVALCGCTRAICSVLSFTALFALCIRPFMYVLGACSRLSLSLSSIRSWSGSVGCFASSDASYRRGICTLYTLLLDVVPYHRRACRMALVNMHTGHNVPILFIFLSIRLASFYFSLFSFSSNNKINSARQLGSYLKRREYIYNNKSHAHRKARVCEHSMAKTHEGICRVYYSSSHLFI